MSYHLRHIIFSRKSPAAPSSEDRAKEREKVADKVEFRCPALVFLGRGHGLTDGRTNGEVAGNTHGPQCPFSLAMFHVGPDRSVEDSLWFQAVTI